MKPCVKIGGGFKRPFFGRGGLGETRQQDWGDGFLKKPRAAGVARSLSASPFASAHVRLFQRGRLPVIRLAPEASGPFSARIVALAMCGFKGCGGLFACPFQEGQAAAKARARQGDGAPVAALPERQPFPAKAAARQGMKQCPRASARGKRLPVSRKDVSAAGPAEAQASPGDGEPVAVSAKGRPFKRRSLPDRG